MKKCYTITLLCLISALVANAQTDRFWVGPSSGAGSNWNNTANWSATSGGVGGASVPNGAGFNAIFNQGAVVNVDITPLTLNSISVTNNSTAVLYTSVATTITLNSTNVATPALNVDAGSLLRDSTTTSVNFITSFGANARAEIDGDVRLGRDPSVIGNTDVILNPVAAGLIFNVNSTGRIILGFRGALGGTATTLQFNAGSNLIFDRDGGSAPAANYNPSSTIQIIGNTTTGTSLLGSPASVGNLEYNSPNLNPVSGTPGINMGSGTTIKGNLRILNTNNRKLSLASSQSAGTPLNITVQGNFEISGNSVVSLSAPPVTDPARDINMIVNGNFVQSGGTFSLQDFNAITRPTTLSVKGNLVQSGGNFTVGSSAINNSTNLFVVELSGTSNQNVSVSSGTIDNSNAQVALRMNNPAGATLLTPLSVGRMDFVNGILTTGVGTPLSINNTSNDAFVINNVSDASHVNGPVKRRTNLTAAYAFPTGKGGNYRVIEVIPTTTTVSEYTAEYFNSNHPDPDVALPLTGRSTVEYWNVMRGLGSNAAVRLTLEGQVPGATAAHDLVVARYISGVWWNVKVTTGTTLNGASTSGTVTSQEENTFGDYTFGYGPAGALPIKLTQFDATKAGSAVNIHWRAECTSTQAVFEIERSTDGRNFQKIETIVADKQRCLLPFDYVDRAPAAGNNFYRVKVVDVDGKAFYSRVVAVINRSKGFELVGVYPSLITTGQLKVNVTAASRDKVELYITNISGQVIKRMQAGLNAGENIIYINVDGLAAGTYQVSGRNSEGELKSLRFIKQ
jgi:hypothetical protein